MSADDLTDVARLRRAFASVSDETMPDTVDAERIFDALHGRMSQAEREAVVDQLLLNPAAAEAWRLASEMSPERTAQMPAVTASHERRRSATYRWLSMAAAAMLGVGLSMALLSRPPAPAVYRSVETRSIGSAMASDATLSRTDPVLRWTGVDGARYRVRVLTSELEVLQESSELNVREFRLGEDTLRRIAPGSDVLWQVEGRVPGETVIVSPTFTIHVP